MKSKTIFLLFVFGAIAVLAEEENVDGTGISEEEESTGEEEIGNDQSNGAFKIEEIFNGLQEFQGKTPQPHLESKDKKNVLWERTEKSMKNFNERGDQIFRKKETDFVDKKEDLEDAVKLNLNQTQEILERQINKTQTGTEDGKDPTEVQECFNENMDSFNKEVDDYKKSAFECFNNVTADARETLEKSKDAFNQTFLQDFEEVKNLTAVESCKNPQKKNQCLKERLPGTVKKLQKMVKTANTNMTKLEETLQKLYKQMEGCSSEFQKKLNEKKDATSTKLSECSGSDSDTAKPGVKEEEEEEDDLEKELEEEEEKERKIEEEEEEEIKKEFEEEEEKEIQKKFEEEEEIKKKLEEEEEEEIKREIEEEEREKKVKEEEEKKIEKELEEEEEKEKKIEEEEEEEIKKELEGEEKEKINVKPEEEVKD